MNLKMLFLIAFLLIFHLGRSQKLVQDVNDVLIGSQPLVLESNSDRAYFVADSDEFGREIFWTEGEETVLLTDFSTQQDDARYYDLYLFEDYILVFLLRPQKEQVELWKIFNESKQKLLLQTFRSYHKSYLLNDCLYYFSRNRNRSLQFWKTYGTKESILLFKEIPNAHNLRNVIDFKDMLFFSMNHPDYGEELWRSDGTNEGTVLVKDIEPDGSSKVSSFCEYKESLYFQAYTKEYGYEFWKTDGTKENTLLVADINPGTNSSSPRQITAVGDLLFFTASDGRTGYEPWVSDGTASGTKLLKDINMTHNSSPNGFVAYNNNAYFSAYHPNHGTELWRSDGTPSGTYLVKDIDGTNKSAVPSFYYKNRIVHNGLLYFKAGDFDGKAGRLWQTDGTSSGTRLVVDSLFDLNYSLEMNRLGDDMLLALASSSAGDELWRFSPNQNQFTALTHLNQSRTFSADIVYSLTANKGKLFFFADHEYYGKELWILDTLSNHAQLLRDLSPGPSSSYFVHLARERILTLENGYVFFLANPNSSGAALWRSDGTSEGTIYLKSTSATAYALFDKFDEAIYFPSKTPDGKDGLWKTNGEVGSPELLKAFSGKIALSSAASSDRLFFTADDGIHGLELWMTDGTSQGTVMVEDINPSGDASPEDIYVIGDQVYFSAFTEEYGRELWRYDSQSEQVELMKDISRGSGGSYTSPMFEIEGALLFTAENKQYGTELWKTEGTAISTVLLKDVYPGSHSGLIGSSYDTYADGKTGFFGAISPRNGQEVWTTDGTADGTTQVKNLSRGNFWSSPFGFYPIGNGNIIFTANTGGNNTSKIFVTDGTEAGTFEFTQAVDFNVQPFGFTRIGDKIYYTSGNDEIGRELWSFSIDVCNQNTINFDKTQGGGIYQAADQVTLSDKTEDHSSLVVKAGYEIVFEAGFETADDGWLTAFIEECVEADETVGVEPREEEIVEQVTKSVLRCFPNPANVSTKVQYDLSKTTHVNISIYSMLGERILSLFDGQQIAGSHELEWHISKVMPGNYFIVLQANHLTAVQQITVIE
ncbi:MAG: ELWxxDGT repeat protein [Bacteroidota bacterium]